VTQEQLVELSLDLKFQRIELTGDLPQTDREGVALGTRMPTDAVGRKVK